MATANYQQQLRQDVTGLHFSKAQGLDNGAKSVRLRNAGAGAFLRYVTSMAPFVETGKDSTMA